MKTIFHLYKTDMVQAFFARKILNNKGQSACMGGKRAFLGKEDNRSA